MKCQRGDGSLLFCAFPLLLPGNCSPTDPSFDLSFRASSSALSKPLAETSLDQISPQFVLRSGSPIPSQLPVAGPMLNVLCILQDLTSLLRALYNCWGNLLWLCPYSAASAEGEFLLCMLRSSCTGSDSSKGRWSVALEGKTRRKSMMESHCLRRSNPLQQYLVILALLWVFKGPRGLRNSSHRHLDSVCFDLL